MMHNPHNNFVCHRRITRRNALRAGCGFIGALSLPAPGVAKETASVQRPKIAVLFDVCRHRSHANVILENFLLPYYFNGKKIIPAVDIVSFYADQLPDGEFSRDVSREFGIPIYPTIRGALCQGGNRLAVDGVMSIVEGGDYPMNELGQKEYPRKRFFDEIIAVMRESQRFVPLFSDKHLSYRWEWAKEMYDTAQQSGIPLMAGSSVPLAERRPAMEIPVGTEIEEAVSIHGGPAEIYDIHAMEILQSIVEARGSQETGVSRVEFLHGDALWNAASEGRWSRTLAEAAMQAEFGGNAPPLHEIPGEAAQDAHGVLITYKDGLTATSLRVGNTNKRWNFACRVRRTNEVYATQFFVGPWRNRYLFKAFSHAIQHFLIQGAAPYPVERTLLTTGMLDAAMRSRQEGRAVATPELEFGYQPRDFKAFRETGATWKVIDVDIPEPQSQLDRSGTR